MFTDTGPAARRRRMFIRGAGLVVTGAIVGSIAVRYGLPSIFAAAASEVPAKEQPRVTVPVSPMQIIG
jgi:hypothetical protein